MTSTTRQVEVPARQTQYTLPRKFLQGSKLHLYLAVKEPEMIQANKLEYTLFVVSIYFSYLNYYCRLRKALKNYHKGLTPNTPPLIQLWCARSKLNMDEICSLNINL